jgi:transcriptional regulator with XRE-family HTH domain
MKFNEKIVKLRKLKGLTQDEFAAAVGVSRQAVYKWESGQSYPEVPKLLEMKLLFDISIDDLLDENFEVVLPEKTKKRRISREKKVEIEVSVEKEVNTVKEEIVKEEIVKEETLAFKAPVVENVIEIPEVKVEAEVINEEKKEEANEKKKSGFFGRLFGRK